MKRGRAPARAQARLAVEQREERKCAACGSALPARHMEPFGDGQPTGSLGTTARAWPLN